MRETLRPVTLRRIVEVTDLCQRLDGVTPMNIIDNLEVSENRANEILSEMVRTSLIEESSSKFRLTSAGDKLREGFETEDWRRMRDVLYENSPHYQAFIDVLDSHNEKYGLTKEEMLGRLENTEAKIRFNKTGFDIVSDWGERLGAIQRNVFEDRYYSIAEPREEAQFVDVLQDEYSGMEVERGVNLKQRYVSIPEIRELVCERMRLTRNRFDEELIDISQKNVGRMELSGAPLDTQAKESRFGIKTISKDQDAGQVTSKMESDRILDGVSLSDGKMYYYLAIFEQLMED